MFNAHSQYGPRRLVNRRDRPRNCWLNPQDRFQIGSVTSVFGRVEEGDSGICGNGLRRPDAETQVRPTFEREQD